MKENNEEKRNNDKSSRQACWPMGCQADRQESMQVKHVVKKDDKEVDSLADRKRQVGKKIDRQVCFEQ